MLIQYFGFLAFILLVSAQLCHSKSANLTTTQNTTTDPSKEEIKFSVQVSESNQKKIKGKMSTIQNIAVAAASSYMTEQYQLALSCGEAEYYDRGTKNCEDCFSLCEQNMKSCRIKCPDDYVARKYGLAKLADASQSTQDTVAKVETSSYVALILAIAALLLWLATVAVYVWQRATQNRNSKSNLSHFTSVEKMSLIGDSKSTLESFEHISEKVPRTGPAIKNSTQIPNPIPTIVTSPMHDESNENPKDISHNHFTQTARPHQESGQDSTTPKRN